jgi:hypothetical protein
MPEEEEIPVQLYLGFQRSRGRAGRESGAGAPGVGLRFALRAVAGLFLAFSLSATLRIGGVLEFERGARAAVARHVRLDN